MKATLTYNLSDPIERMLIGAAIRVEKLAEIIHDIDNYVWWIQESARESGKKHVDLSYLKEMKDFLDEEVIKGGFSDIVNYVTEKCKKEMSDHIEKQQKKEAKVKKHIKIVKTGVKKEDV